MPTQLILWGFKSLPADGAAWEQVVWLGACGYEGEGLWQRALLWTGLPSFWSAFPQTGELRLGKAALPADLSELPAWLGIPINCFLDS